MLQSFTGITFGYLNWKNLNEIKRMGMLKYTALPELNEKVTKNKV